MKNKRYQSGLTLVETLASLAILSAVMVGAAQLSDRYLTDTKAMVTAQHLRTVGEAGRAYIQNNYGALLSSATATVPVVIPVSALSPYLTGTYSATNNYGQTTCILVLQPIANNLDALVVTTGGTAIDDVSLAQVAGTVGAAGGGIYASAATTLRGAMGQWSAAFGNFSSANKSCADGVSAGTVPLTAGHPVMALWLSDQSIGSAFLYRDQVPGRPDLNTMNTPVIFSAMSVQTVGAACSTTGAFARDAAGSLVSCQGGQWKGGAGGLNWKGWLTSPASLPAAGNSNGDAYRISGVGGHAFVWDAAGGSWQGMVVDSAGNLTLAGAIYTSGGSSWYGAITMQGSKNGWSGIDFRDAAGATSGTLMMHPSYSGFYRADWGGWRWYVDENGNTIQPGSAVIGGSASVSGTTTSSGRLTTGEYLQVNGIGIEGAVCPGSGLMARDGTGMLECRSGTWKRTGGGTPYQWGGTYFTMSYSCVSANPFTGGCSCPSGYSTHWSYQILLSYYWEIYTCYKWG